VAPKEPQPPPDQAIRAPRAAFSIDQYPLKNSAILDSATTIHIFNQITRFIDFRTAPDGDFLWAGDSRVPILGYGDVDIQVEGPKGKLQVLRLYDAAYCENFAANLVSFRQLQKQGYWWDTRPRYNCLRRGDDTVVATLREHYHQYVLEYIPDDHPYTQMAFYIRKHKFNSSTERRPVTGDAMRWHLRLGHPGPQALEHLVNASKGVRLSKIKTVNCDACGMAKAKRRIRREPREFKEEPGVQLALDFHDYVDDGYGGYKCLLLVTDRWSGLSWDYYLTDHKSATILAALQHLFGVLEQCKIRPQTIECDNEIFMKRKAVLTWLQTDQHVKVEPSPPHVKDLDGAAERSGGIVKDKARAMRQAAKLPAALWPEIDRAAVYLHNRTPRYQYNWKSPYDRFHTYLSHRDGVVVPDRRPQQAHLKVYGCKAFALTTEYLKKEKRLHRFNPKAWIGFLVGYDSTNVYRIWNPIKNIVVRARDVIFDEDQVFDGNLEKLQDDCRDVDLNVLSALLTQLDVSQRHENDPNTDDLRKPLSLDDNDECILIGNPGALDETVNEVEENQELIQLAQQAVDAMEQDSPEPIQPPYPTPPLSPPAALLAAAIQRPESSELTETFSPSPKQDVWKAAFHAGQMRQHIGHLDGKILDRAQLQRLLRSPMGMRGVHRRNLPPPPTRHKDLEMHPLGQLFEQAETDHLQSHIPMNSWTKIDRLDAQGEQVLDCMWIYVYKFDKHGRLLKCKARLVVRGDQQAKAELDTYAATLAARSFRTFMAIAARFDLELKQYDAVNAFVHAPLDSTVYMRMPPGYGERGKIYRLNKAVYGLRKAPLLWQRMFTSTLLEIGFTPIPHEPCCFACDGVLIFFYVDDIVVAYRKSNESLARDLMSQLKRRYNLSGGEDLQWFLGIEVHRDRAKGLIWLNQASYIDKIVKLANTNQPDETPMAKIELFPYEERASGQAIRNYQRKIGSLLYAAVTTRIDIAFAVSRLARFLTNPGPEHHAAADRVFHYLYRHRGLGLQLGGADDFLVATDASFADNTLDRKSSQAYVMVLFGGVVG
jgi:Reverse transcriptase (RNA-dependent DNA polymerase)/GAG-pre-integrase domain